MKTRIAHAGDIDIAYKIFGKGHPLILIMGYMGTMDMWDRTMLKMLSAHYRVIIFDNRGMGQTTASSKNFTIKLFADDVAHLLDALRIKSSHVLGWSMGTNIALEFALKYPKKANKLILYAADCGGKNAVPPTSKIINQLNSIDDNPKKKKEKLFKFLFSSRWLRKNLHPYGYLPQAKETSSPENLNRQTKAIETWPGVYRKLNKIKQPTLLITGMSDVLTPPANSLLIAKRLPQAWLVQIKDGGHGVMYQYPRGFSKIILTFLEA